MNRFVYEYEKATINMLKRFTDSIVENFIPHDDRDKELMISFIENNITLLNNSLYKKEVFEEDKKYNEELKKCIKSLEEHKQGILLGKIKFERKDILAVDIDV